MFRFKIILVSVFFCTLSFSQNCFKTNTYRWFSGIEKEHTNRQTKLGFGINSNFGELVFKETPLFGQKLVMPEFEISYNDYYVFSENNPHNFISYNGLRFSFGELTTSERDNKLNPEGFKYGIGLTKGFGYQSDFITVIPFNRSSTTWQQFELETTDINKALSPIESKTYSGKNRETGVMLIFDYGLELDLSYSLTSFSSESNFGKSMVSNLLEFGSTRLLSYGLQELFSDSKFFPIIDYVAELALRTLFISLRRDKYFFPFEGQEEFTISTFNIGIKKSFEINLF